MNEKALDRFNKFYIVDEATGCWIWQGSHSRGYPDFWLDGKTRKACRVAYEHFIGPLGDLTVDHLVCRNTSCVNHEHFEAVTHGVNSLRSNNPPAVNSRRVVCLNGHPLSGENLYVDPTGRRACKICRKERMRGYRSQRTTSVNG